MLIDGQPLMLEGITSALSGAEDIHVAGAVLRATDAFKLLEYHPADVVLTEIHLSGMNGIEVCKKVKELYPQIKVLALTTLSQYEYIREMLQSGAWGYMLKSATRKELLEAIYAVRNNKKYFSMEVIEILLQRSSQPVHTLPRLTRREKEVLQLIAQGFTNQEIANKLFISILTVISHRKNLMVKFEAVNTATLISKAAPAWLSIRKFISLFIRRKKSLLYMIAHFINRRQLCRR